MQSFNNFYKLLIEWWKMIRLYIVYIFLHFFNCSLLIVSFKYMFIVLFLRATSVLAECGTNNLAVPIRIAYRQLVRFLSYFVLFTRYFRPGHDEKLLKQRYNWYLCVIAPVLDLYISGFVAYKLRWRSRNGPETINLAVRFISSRSLHSLVI